MRSQSSVPDLIAASPAVLLLVVIDSKEVSSGDVVLHPGMVQLVGVAADVVLEPGESHLGPLGAAVSTAGSGDHYPGQESGAGGSGALMSGNVTLRATSGAVGNIVSAIVIITT